MKKKTSQRKRPNGDGSIFKRQDGKWIAQLSLGTVSGKRVRRKRVCDTQLQARLQLEKLREEASSGTLTSSSKKCRLSDFLDLWLSEVIKPNRAENTTSSYRYAIKNHIAPDLGHLHVSELEPLHIQSWLSRSEAGARTKQNAYKVLSQAMKHAVKLKLIIENPCTPVETPKYEREEIFPFTEDEVQQILKSVRFHRLRAVFYLGFYCALGGMDI